MDLAGPLIELDKRGRTTPRRLLPEARHKVIDFILSHEASCSEEIHSCLRTFISNTARTATILNRARRRQSSKQYSRQCVETDQFWSLLRVNAQAANTR